MAVVAGHVINEYVKVAHVAGRVTNGRLKGRDIGDIRLAIPGAGQSRLLYLSDQFLRGRFGDIHERDQRSLSRKCLGHAAANSRATAGDENTPAAQRWVTGAAIRGGRGVSTIEGHWKDLGGRCERR